MVVDGRAGVRKKTATSKIHCHGRSSLWGQGREKGIWDEKKIKGNHVRMWSFIGGQGTDERVVQKQEGATAK